MKKILTDIIYQYKNEIFDWGKFDCCIFTASVVEEFTGRDLPYWKDVLNYNDFKGSMRTLRGLGCKELRDLPGIILDTEELPISEVKLGYPVYYINEKGQGLLGICNGVRAYILQDLEGLTTRPIEDCECCWSID